MNTKRVRVVWVYCEPRQRLTWLGALLVFSLLIGACQVREFSQHNDSADILVSLDEIQSAPTEVPVTDIPPTAVFVEISEPSPGEETTLTPETLPSVDPLRFVFPTQRAGSVSAWRPPLYQVPWALSPHDHFYFTRPIAADEVNWPLPDYRYGGRFFANVVHTGVDIPSPEGTLVLAAGPGKVIQAGYGVYSGLDDPEDPYGLAVVIRHDFGYQGNTLYTIYGHLSLIEVTEGQRVKIRRSDRPCRSDGFHHRPSFAF